MGEEDQVREGENFQVFFFLFCFKDRVGEEDQVREGEKFQVFFLLFCFKFFQCWCNGR